jgi:hypothetical protein
MFQQESRLPAGERALTQGRFPMWGPKWLTTGRVLVGMFVVMAAGCTIQGVNNAKRMYPHQLSLIFPHFCFSVVLKPSYLKGYISLFNLCS